MKKNKEKNFPKSKNKMFYLFIGCIVLSLLIIGATFAYFLASVQDLNTVQGGTYTTSINLAVERVTTTDLITGLIPMKNKQSPHAAEQLCYDDNKNTGCQIYKITISTEGEEELFIDGYLRTMPQDGVETRFTRVYPKEVNSPDEQEPTTIFNTKYTQEDFELDTFDETQYIKTGKKQSAEDDPFNKVTDYDCILAENEKITSKEEEESTAIYFMLWVYDNGKEQNNIQGLKNAYTGEITIITSQGSEIKATFN